LRENVEYKNNPDFAILVRFADYSNGFDESKFIYIDEHAYNFLSKSSLEGGEIIMSNVGSCGMFFRCPILNKKMSLAPNSILIKSEYIDYLYHWFGCKIGQEAIKKITSKSAMPKFNKTEFKKIEIPIPSLAKQQEIVSHLDAFTTLISNLESELDMRRKQYEHYRNQLLDFEGVEGVEWKPYAKVGTITDYVSNGSFADLRNNVEYKQAVDYVAGKRNLQIRKQVGQRQIVSYGGALYKETRGEDKQLVDRLKGCYHRIDKGKGGEKTAKNEESAIEKVSYFRAGETTSKGAFLFKHCKLGFFEFHFKSTSYLPISDRTLPINRRVPAIIRKSITAIAEAYPYSKRTVAISVIWETMVSTAYWVEGKPASSIAMELTEKLD
jgi:hypothetical protein